MSSSKATIASADVAVLSQAQRWCAALGVTPDLTDSVPGLRRAWQGAGAILVGDDMLAAAAAAPLGPPAHGLVVAHAPQNCWAQALELGAAAVCDLDDDRQALDLLAAASQGPARAPTLAILGGCGGAGASTLTVALAHAVARRGLKPLAVDADPLGSGLDLLLGAEHVDGMRWPDFAGAQGRIEADTLGQVLPHKRGVALLGWARGTADAHENALIPHVLESIVASGRRAFDAILIDSPRGARPGPDEVLAHSDAAIVVVPEDLASLASARRVVGRARDCVGQVGVVTVRRRGALGARTAADVLSAEVIASYRPSLRLRDNLEAGLGPVGSRSLSRSVAIVLEWAGVCRGA